MAELRINLTETPVVMSPEDSTGYPENEMGYFRMYYKANHYSTGGNWYGTAFRIHTDLESQELVAEFDDVINSFRREFKDLSELKAFCRANAKVRYDWCGYDRWVLYLTLEHGSYEFDVRTMPGDYNLYLRCYKKEAS